MVKQRPSESSEERKSQVRDYFSRTAQNYVASASHRTGEDLKRLVEIGQWDLRQHVLDIATGGGHTALAVAPHVAQVMVTDLTPTMLAKAQAFLTGQGVRNARFQVADAENLPFADASFDRVTCRIAPHHFPNVAKAVQEVARVLQPGGLFLLIDSIVASDAELDTFDNTVEKWRDSSHMRSCSVEEWLMFFSQAELLVERREFFRKTQHYDRWTELSLLSPEKKAALEHFILGSNERIRRHFEVSVRTDGHLESFCMDFILLAGRKM